MNLDLEQVFKYYRELEHQKKALEFIEKTLTTDEIKEFYSIWRSPVEESIKANPDLLGEIEFHMTLRKAPELLYGQMILRSTRKAQMFHCVASSGARGWQSHDDFYQVAKGCIPPCKDLIVDLKGFHSEVRGVEGMFYPIVSTKRELNRYRRSGFGVHLDANLPGCFAVEDT